MRQYIPEGVSVLVTTESEATARLVGPELARRQYPDMKLTGKVLYCEWYGQPEDYTLPGYEVVIEVYHDAESHLASHDDPNCGTCIGAVLDQKQPMCQECGASDTEHMGHFARCSQWTPKGELTGRFRPCTRCGKSPAVHNSNLARESDPSYAGHEYE